MTSVSLASVWKPCARYGLRLGANLNVDNGTASAAHQLGLGVQRHSTVQTVQSAPGMVERGIHLRDRGIRPALSEIVARNEHEKTSPYLSDLADSCPLVGRYTIAASYPGGACPLVGNPAGTGYFGIGGVADSSEYPAAGERATTLRRGRYLAPAAPATTPAAPAAAVRASPGGSMNGKPNPAPKLESAAANGDIIGTSPSSAAGPLAAQPQPGGTDNPPTEAA